MAERTFDDFDSYANEYRNIHTENIKLSGVDSFYFAEMKVKLLTAFEKNELIKILDVGCGDGAVESYMHEYFPAWIINGIDVSSESIQQAIKKKISNTTFSFYDGTSIPFADGSFDVVFMAGVLHHINFSMHTVLIKEIQRVLKANGRFYLFEHNPFNPATKYLVNTCVFDKDAKLLKASYTNDLLKKNDLLVDETQYIIFFPRKGILSKLIFLEKYLKWIPLGGQYFMRARKQH